MPGKSLLLTWLAALTGLAAAVFIWIGFLFPDSLYLDRYPGFGGWTLWAARIGIPIAALAAAWIVRRVRTRKTSADRPLLLLAVLLLLGLLVYPVADWRYHAILKAGRRSGDMYAFLQLAPRPIPPDAAAGDGFRLFCLGGSTTEFTDSHGRDWPSRVEERLRSGPGRKNVSVLNCGRQWYTTLHMLIQYETSIRPLRPDVIVVMETINDLLVNADFSYFSAGPFRPDYGHFFGPLSGPVFHRSLPSSALENLGRLWHFRERRVVEQDTFPGLASFRRNLECLIDLARNDGTAVVLMTQPNLYRESLSPAEERALTMARMEAVGPDRRWSVRTARNGFLQYRGSLMDVARSRNAPILDLEAAVPKSLDYFKDDVHYRDPAFDLVADAVAAFLTKENLKGL
jgi:lysophospholipase L1-like esterase